MRLAIFLVLGCFTMTTPHAATAETIHLFPYDALACMESGLDTLQVDGCSQVFVRTVGRVSWPPLEIPGPVTISVLAYRDYYTSFPTYLAIRDHQAAGPCTTLLAEKLTVLEISGVGSSQCGVWESIGPVNLSDLEGLGSGSFFSFQLLSFFDPYSDTGSPGIAEIRITPEEVQLEQNSWSQIRLLYR